MAVVASQLKALAATSPTQLPRFGSDRSGATFARIVSSDNLTFMRPGTLPLAVRGTQMGKCFHSLNEILNIYLSAFLAHQTSDRDIVEILGAILRLGRESFKLVDEIVPTFSKDDPAYADRMAGLNTFRQGMALIVIGACTTLTEDRDYGVEARSRLLTICRETFPDLVSKLESPSQLEVLKRLDDLVANPATRENLPEITSLRDEVRSAVKPNP